jgi:cholesterol transport system auxiliary component
VDTLRVAPVYQGQALVYRLATHEFETDPYAEFIVPPERMLRSPIIAYLRAAGLYSDIVELGGARQANQLLEVQALELYGDFRDRDQPAAVLHLRFALSDLEEGRLVRTIYERDFPQRLPISERSPEQLVAGWSSALEQAMSTLTEELRTVAQRPIH